MGGPAGRGPRAGPGRRQSGGAQMARRNWLDRFAMRAAAVGVLLAAGAIAAAPVSSADSPAIAVDGTSAGRTFDGVGALSAGASSRLLIDYPPAQRSQILDYLFKPGYGAAQQILKVEIGGDTNSTDGAEPSHMRSASEVDCNRGYEWWLMEQAKLRNPAIKLSALEWGTPGWVGAGARTVWTSQNIDYLLSWLGCAREHGLHDRLPGRVERGRLRRELVRRIAAGTRSARIRGHPTRRRGQLRLDRRGREHAEQPGVQAGGGDHRRALPVHGIRLCHTGFGARHRQTHIGERAGIEPVRHRCARPSQRNSTASTPTGR